MSTVTTYGKFCFVKILELIFFFFSYRTQTLRHAHSHPVLLSAYREEGANSTDENAWFYPTFKPNEGFLKSNVEPVEVSFEENVVVENWDDLLEDGSNPLESKSDPNTCAPAVTVPTNDSGSTEDDHFGDLQEGSKPEQEDEPNSVEDEVEVVDVEEEKRNMDEALMYAFLVGAKEMIADSDLPIPAADFFQQYMCKISHIHLDLKKSNHKKLAKFVKLVCIFFVLCVSVCVFQTAPSLPGFLSPVPWRACHARCGFAVLFVCSQRRLNMVFHSTGHR